LVHIQNLTLPYFQPQTRDLPSYDYRLPLPKNLIECCRAALLCLTIYQPWNRSVAITFGAMRALSDLSDIRLFFICNQAPDKKTLLNTAVSITTLYITTRSLPLGVAITTSQELLSDACDFFNYSYKLTTQPNDSERTLMLKRTLVRGLDCANDALYLGSILTGSLPLVTTSLALQALVRSYHSYTAYNEGYILEAMAHLSVAIFQ
jgi:hypothetical protein